MDAGVLTGDFASAKSTYHYERKDWSDTFII